MRNSRVSSAPASAISWICSVSIPISASSETMQPRVLSLGGEDLQILKIVVARIAIDMVNDFTWL